MNWCSIGRNTKWYHVLLHNVGPSAKHLSTPIDMLIVQRQKLENIVDLVQLFGENLTVES